MRRRQLMLVAAFVAIIVTALVISRSGWFEVRPASGTASAMSEAADRPVTDAR